MPLLTSRFFIFAAIVNIFLLPLERGEGLKGLILPGSVQIESSSSTLYVFVQWKKDPELTFYHNSKPLKWFMASPEKHSTKNRLLAALPPSEYRRLLPKLESVSLSLKQRVYESLKTIKYVYFPLNGIISIVAFMRDGTGIEVATVGNEGMVGLPVFFGADRTPLVAFQQIPGESMRMESKAFTKEIKRSGPLTAILHLYTQTFVVQIAQGNACNRAHSIEQRCARWLLTTHDRVGRRERFFITQEFLGQMLGVRRAGVNEVASAFRKSKLIDYKRGIIHILNRKGLEKRTCECYWVIKNEIDRSLSKRS